MKTLSNLSFSEIVPYIGTDNNKVKEILQSYGIQKKISTYLAHSLEEDWDICKDVPYEKKIWALQRGFLPSRIKLYGFNRE